VLTGSKVFARKGSGVNQKLLGTTRRKDGKLEVTYNRHPLYTDSSDTKKSQGGAAGCPGNTRGTWYLLNKLGRFVNTGSGPACQLYPMG
jgi:ribosomal protein L31